MAMARRIVDHLLQEYSIDRSRIYVGGVSSGGDGSWAMLAAWPDLFAAALPMASGGFAGEELARVVDIPIWAFHVRDDDGTAVDGVRSTVARLQALGGMVWLSETPGLGHDCWTMATERFQAVQWLLAQRKGINGPPPNYRDVGVSAQLLKQTIAGSGAQYYLVVPVTLIVCWWLAKRQWRVRKQKQERMDPSGDFVGGDVKLSAASRGPTGFTIVELLVVIGIIGVLVALLLPAVQMARESSRRSSCANNLRQQAVAVKLHEGTHKIFPTGGWGGEWLGDPDAGYGPTQPGGWIYNVLSFIEQDNLRQLGRGLKGAARDQALVQLMESHIDVFYCPSRRLPRLYPYTGDELKNYAKKPPDKVAKTDYAISRTVSHEKSEVFMPDIQLQGKGASKTVLAGEKSLAFDGYDAGGAGDSLISYVGDSDDIRREPTGSPTPDRGAGSGDPRTTGFGAAHPSGANIAYCDGSVRFVLADEPLEP
jgi:prepilin-type processing-associated H-X9-DG protein/prepilin-type N-terminal cleavage/methylation domain-containing protein